MLFRTLTKEEFRSLVEIILETNEIIAPRKVADGKDGKPIHQFLPVASFEEIDLDYETTEYSAKTYFLPYRENLSTFHFDDDDWEQEIRYRIQPRAIIGLHACDINALLKLDKVFARDFFPSPYYISRRKNTFIVGIDHEPCEDGFCRSMGTDTVTHGFDLFLTDLGDRYFVAIDSDRGFSAAAAGGGPGGHRRRTPTPTCEVRQRIADGFQDRRRRPQPAQPARHRVRVRGLEEVGREVPELRQLRHGLPHLLLLRRRPSGSPWTSTTATKIKQLYSCNLLDFAAGCRRPQLPARPGDPPEVPLLPPAPGLRGGLRRAQVRRLQPLRPGLPGRHQPARGDPRPAGGGRSMSTLLHPYDVTQEAEMLRAARLQPAEPPQARRPGLQGGDHQHHPADRDGEALPRPDPRRRPSGSASPSCPGSS